MQPLIGITTSQHVDQHDWLYHKGYAKNAESVMGAGGLPVYIPLGLPEDATRALYERLDGILLSGGDDIDPTFYGEARHELTQKPDVGRDTMEIALARWAVADDRPVLGICRGHQVLNVAFGGKLVQDMDALFAGEVAHTFPFSEPRSVLRHDVMVDADSQLAQIVGETRFLVNSIHHQGVTTAGDGLRVVGRTADGLVEAVEYPGKRFVVSVQWHPEDLTASAAPAQRLFSAFVEAARERTPIPSR